MAGPGIALRSTDGGTTWQEMRHPALALTHLDFIDRQIGFALEGTTLVTTSDAGGTWARRGSLPSGGQARLQQLTFFDASMGLVASDGCNPDCGAEVSRTSDGGRTWAVVSTISSDRSFSFKTLQIGSDGTAVLAGAYGLAVSTDYGATWQLAPHTPEGDNILLGAGRGGPSAFLGGQLPRCRRPICLTSVL